MVKGIIASVVFLVIILTFFAYQSNKSIDDIQIEKAKIEIKILAENLDTPWAIDFLPDDRLIFTERSGRVSILKNEKTKLRCGAGHSGYAITQSGKIVACPIMNCIKSFYAGDIKFSNKKNLKKFSVSEPCTSCDYLDLCGGRSLLE